MRKESSTLQKCKRQMATLGFDSQLAYHRVKLILKIYRDVVWVLSERVEELHEYAWELGAQDADTGLIYLQSFAPDMDLQEFEERVCCVMENRMLVDVIDRALLRLKRYPDRGELYPGFPLSFDRRGGADLLQPRPVFWSAGGSAPADCRPDPAGVHGRRRHQTHCCGRLCAGLLAGDLGDGAGSAAGGAVFLHRYVISKIHSSSATRNDTGGAMLTNRSWRSPSSAATMGRL